MVVKFTYDPTREIQYTQQTCAQAKLYIFKVQRTLTLFASLFTKENTLLLMH